MRSPAYQSVVFCEDPSSYFYVFAFNELGHQQFCVCSVGTYVTKHTLGVPGSPEGEC